MSTSKSPGDHFAGAGLSLSSPAAGPDNTTQPKSQPSIASRALALSSYFLSGALCINLSQFLGTPLYLINRDWYNAWIAFTKQSFGLLTMTLTQTFSPTKVIVSGDASVRGQLLQQTDGTLLLDFPERLVLIANHQIYTDWLYLWWTAYCSGMHGRLYIVLKESLKKIPILGWGMQFSQFIFLKRNWEKDREHMAKALQRLNKLADPMWLLLFPEGTNLAQSTREKSAKWAAKNNIKDMRHCLLPRSTGLRFCLQELEGTVDYLYDCTIAYEGVPRGAFAQDIFTLRAGYLEGRPPKSVSMYWRRFAIKNIPLRNEKAFELWLLARWREKDLLIENYLIHGRFPADTGVSETPQGTLKRGAGHLTVEIKSSHWYEFLQIFAPMGILAMVLYIFYGALPQKFFNSKTGRAVKESKEDLQTLKSSVTPPAMPTSFNFDMLFDKEKQAESFGNAGMALAEWVRSPEAKRMLGRADLVQKWLEDPQKLLVESLSGNTDKQNFLKALEEEKNRRKRLTNKHQGTFWQDLEDAEASTKGSIIQKPSTSTFYQDLANAQAARSSVVPGALTKANLQRKATFWDDLEKESNRRAGTVLTLPTLSSSSSATLIGSLGTTTAALKTNPNSSSPPKLSTKKPKKLSNATTSKIAKPPTAAVTAAASKPVTVKGKSPAPGTKAVAVDRQSKPPANNKIQPPVNTENNKPKITVMKTATIKPISKDVNQSQNQMKNGTSTSKSSTAPLKKKPKKLGPKPISGSSKVSASKS